MECHAVQGFSLIKIQMELFCFVSIKRLQLKFHLSTDKSAFKICLSGLANVRLGQIGQLISGPMLGLAHAHQYVEMVYL